MRQFAVLAVALALAWSANAQNRFDGNAMLTFCEKVERGDLADFEAAFPCEPPR